VIDEVVGQMIALLFIPNFLWLDWQLIIAGFVLFRIFDIWKPYPIRNLEKLPGGVGVMADDVVAGCYAATALAVIVAFRSVL
jgi:phosphatidylglycerophosphatase A